MASDAMDPAYLQQIRDYYETWTGSNLISLKHRTIKILVRSLSDPEIRWYHFHQLINKRRIYNDGFSEQIRDIMALDLIPLRIFQGCVEWLAPNEVNRSSSPRMISSGFIPVENDDDLKTSLKTAQLMRELEPNSSFIFSGNKSIHTWIYSQSPTLSDRELAHADLREAAELKFRKSYFKKIQRKIPYELDSRITQDTRRVVPIPGSLNAFTGRVVTILDSIAEISPEEIIRQSAVVGWDQLPISVFK
jgi:hypothetical protein